MPLHDLTYQRFEGPRTSQFARSFAMARSSGSLLLKRRSFLLLLAVSWIPGILRGAQIFVAEQFPDTFPFLTIDARLWQEFVSQQVTYLPVLLMALYTGAGAISADLASGGFVVYLSKPISRFDYVVGKALPVMSALLAVTLAPALTLLLVHVFLAEDFALFEASPWLPFSVIGYSVWTCLYFTLAVLAISSLSRSPRVAGAGFVALSLGGPIFVRALSRLPIFDPPAFLSMINATVDSGHLFFGNISAGSTPVGSFFAMAASMGIALAILRWRLRSAEVSS